MMPAGLAPHYARFRQVAIFGLVGVSSTAVHYGVALLLSQAMPLAYANPFGFLAAFLVSYLGHSHLTFAVAEGQRRHAERLPRFALVAVAGFCLTQAIVMALSALTGLPNWLILAIALVVVPVLTFIAAKFWVFGSKAAAPRRAPDPASARPPALSPAHSSTHPGALSSAATPALSSYGLAAGLALAFFALTYPHPLQFLLGDSVYFEIGDMPQHVTGWLFFAKDQWRWPLLTTQLVHPPQGIHIALTDSIPLAALLVKPFYAWLPENFQYFGLWHLINKLVLALGAVFLLRSLQQKSLVLALAAACLALLWPASLARLTHTALATHGLLLVALGLYFRSVATAGALHRHSLAFAALNSALLLIHPYLLAMSFAITLAAAADCGLQRRQALGAIEMALASLVAVGGLALLLGYGGSPSDTADTYRIFSMNLLSPVCGGALCAAVDATGGQYEGMNYLGLGCLLIVLLALVRWQGRAVERFVLRHPVFLLMLLGLTVYALSNQIFLGGEKIASYPLFAPLSVLTGIFRAAGRFFWPVGLSLLFLSLVYAFRGRSIWFTLPMLILALCLQWFDTQPLRQANLALLSMPRPFDYSGWNSLAIDRIDIDRPYGCDATIENMKYLYFQIVAARKGIAINTAYLARAQNDCRQETGADRLGPGVLSVFLDPPPAGPLADAIATGLATGSCFRWSYWKTILCLKGASPQDWQALRLP